MEQFNPSMQQQPMAPPPPARPSFLNTLCILSFIMAGIMILLGIWGVIKSLMPYTAQELQAMEMMKNMGMDTAAMDKNPPMQVLSLLAQIISLFGVIMMWKLRKTGFYVYLVGEIAPYIISIAFGGAAAMTSMTGALGSLAAIAYVMIALMVLIDIAFIVMYAVNLKHMH